MKKRKTEGTRKELNCARTRKRKLERMHERSSRKKEQERIKQTNERRNKPATTRGDKTKDQMSPRKNKRTQKRPPKIR